MSQKAVNRWFLAVTLLRNPSFIKYRRQGQHFTASVVTLGSVNFDIPVKNFEINSEGRTLFFPYGSLFRRSAIAWGKGLLRLFPPYNTVCIWVSLLSLLLFFWEFFCISNFLESKCYSLNGNYPKYWPNFIKLVDCGREVSKEAHKVLIKKQFKIVGFHCWLQKWELYCLANMERQMVKFEI